METRVSPVEAICESLRKIGVTYTIDLAGTPLFDGPPLPDDLTSEIEQHQAALSAHLLSRDGGEMSMLADRLWVMECEGATDTRDYRNTLNRYEGRLLLLLHLEKQAEEVAA